MSKDSSRHKLNRLRQYMTGGAKRKRAQEKKDREETKMEKSRKISVLFAHSIFWQLERWRTSHNVWWGWRVSCSYSFRCQCRNCDHNISTQRDYERSRSWWRQPKLRKHQRHTKSATRTVRRWIENDIGLWPARLSAAGVEYWAKTGCSTINNMDGPFDESIQVERIREPKGTKNRFCSRQLFQRTLQNGEKVRRTWLCYSLSTGRVYSFACKLLNGVGNLATIGYGDWKHAGRTFEEHERSLTHCSNVFQLVKHASTLGRVDQEMAKQPTEMQSYWCQVLKRTVSVISFLAERGLAFRGSECWRPNCRVKIINMPTFFQSSKDLLFSTLCEFMVVSCIYRTERW